MNYPVKENTYKVVESGQVKIALQSQEQRLSDLQKSPCQCKLSENKQNTNNLST